MYEEGAKPKGDTFHFLQIKVINQYAGEASEDKERKHVEEMQRPYFYKDGRIIVKLIRLIDYKWRH